MKETLFNMELRVVGYIFKGKLYYKLWNKMNNLIFCRVQKAYIVIVHYRHYKCIKTILPVVWYGWKTWSFTWREEKRLRKTPTNVDVCIGLRSQSYIIMGACIGLRSQSYTRVGVFLLFFNSLIMAVLAQIYCWLYDR